MHDYVATFYGGYDQIGLRRGTRLRPSGPAVALVVASVALLVLVASDVSAYESRPPVVDVTAVDWYGPGGILLLTSAGFTLSGGTTTAFTLTCDPTTSICLPWDGAAVAAPFTLVHFSATLAGVEYTNLTVRAPGAGYDGPLTITLDLPNL